MTGESIDQKFMNVIDSPRSPNRFAKTLNRTILLPAHNTMLSVLLALALGLALNAGAQQINNEPVIGIFTQPYGSTPLPAYIAASYVKYLESAGANNSIKKAESTTIICT